MMTRRTKEKVRGENGLSVFILSSFPQTVRITNIHPDPHSEKIPLRRVSLIGELAAGVSIKRRFHQQNSLAVAENDD